MPGLVWRLLRTRFVCDPWDLRCAGATPGAGAQTFRLPNATSRGEVAQGSACLGLPRWLGDKPPQCSTLGGMRRALMCFYLDSAPQVRLVGITHRRSLKETTGARATTTPAAIARPLVEAVGDWCCQAYEAYHRLPRGEVVVT